jgi:hypothetical protein
MFEGAVNGENFLVHVKDNLAPTLRRGDIVVMDSLPSHKVQGVREAIEAAGASVAYLPPYRPDLNPIEMVFSKLKAQAAAAPRTHRGRPVVAGGRTHPDSHSNRGQKLPTPRRICSALTSKTL